MSNKCVFSPSKVRDKYVISPKKLITTKNENNIDLNSNNRRIRERKISI